MSGGSDDHGVFDPHAAQGGIVQAGLDGQDVAGHQAARLVAQARGFVDIQPQAMTQAMDESAFAAGWRQAGIKTRLTEESRDRAMDRTRFDARAKHGQRELLGAKHRAMDFRMMQAQTRTKVRVRSPSSRCPCRAERYRSRWHAHPQGRTGIIGRAPGGRWPRSCLFRGAATCQQCEFNHLLDMRGSQGAPAEFQDASRVNRRGMDALDGRPHGDHGSPLGLRDGRDLFRGFYRPTGKRGGIRHPDLHAAGFQGAGQSQGEMGPDLNGCAAQAAHQGQDLLLQAAADRGFAGKQVGRRMENGPRTGVAGAGSFEGGNQQMEMPGGINEAKGSVDRPVA